MSWGGVVELLRESEMMRLSRFNRSSSDDTEGGQKGTRRVRRGPAGAEEILIQCMAPHWLGGEHSIAGSEFRYLRCRAGRSQMWRFRFVVILGVLAVALFYGLTAAHGAWYWNAWYWNAWYWNAWYWNAWYWNAWYWNANGSSQEVDFRTAWTVVDSEVDPKIRTGG